MRKLHEYELVKKVETYDYSSEGEKNRHMARMIEDGYAIKAETSNFAQYQKSRKQESEVFIEKEKI